MEHVMQSRTKVVLVLLVLATPAGCRTNLTGPAYPDAGSEPDTSSPACPECDPHAWCAQNADQTVSCTCRDGFLGDGHTCVDVDECAQGTDACDHQHGTCANTEGGYVSSCAPGWNLALDNVTCFDRLVAVHVAGGKRNIFAKYKEVTKEESRLSASLAFATVAP